MMTPITAITLAAKKVGISVSLLQAICMAESGLNNIHNYNDGHSHSWGLCQVKTETARWMGKVTEHKDLIAYADKDLKDHYKNAFAAAVYIKYQLKRYNENTCKAISGYNAGKYISGNKDYVKKVLSHLEDKPKCLNNL